MKLILTEKEILTTIRLSDVQKALLSKITAAVNEKVAYGQISTGRNFIAARDMLNKLGLIEMDQGSETVTVTDEGKQIMKDENLMDDSEQLTADGQQFIEVKGPGDIKDPAEGTPGADDKPPEGGAPGGDDMGLGGEPGAEGGDDLGLGGDAPAGGEGDDFDLDKALESNGSLLQSTNTAVKKLNEVT